jgi:uncharacterized protein YutE (UPF0331/DUF86 family)
MDPDVLRAKLESLERCVARIERRRPPSREVLGVDLDVQDIIVLNLERAVQLCVDAGAHLLADRDLPTPESMAAVFSALATAGILEPSLAARLGAAVGFRNIAVHQYRDIDWDIVWHMLGEGLADFRAFARAVLALLNSSL